MFKSKVCSIAAAALLVLGFGTLDVGTKNCEFVLGFLHEEGIRVAAKDLLDVCPRKVVFFPFSGKAQVRRLNLQPNDTVQRLEREYLSRLGRKPAGGDIEIFAVTR